MGGLRYSRGKRYHPDRMETQLHPWSAYVILPSSPSPTPASRVRSSGSGTPDKPGRARIALGLVVGAPLAGIGLAWTAVRLTPARLPMASIGPRSQSVAPLKGIGSTVAIFISVLAFDDEATRDQAKLAILVASFIAALIGVTALHVRHRLAAGAPAQAALVVSSWWLLPYTEPSVRAKHHHRTINPLIGDPPSIIIAGATDLSFTDFIVRLAPIATLAFIAVTACTAYRGHGGPRGRPSGAGGGARSAGLPARHSSATSPNASSLARSPDARQTPSSRPPTRPTQVPGCSATIPLDGP